MSVDSNLPTPPSGFYFETRQERLTLRRENERDSGLCLDFTADFKEFERQKISAKKNILGRALAAGIGVRVCDLTLGVAGDSSLLVYWGCSVVGVEKNPVVRALVNDALAHGPQVLREGLRVIEDSLQNFVASWDLSSFDVFYLDPMFQHKRSALPKKEMQYLAQLVEPEDERSYLPPLERLIHLKKKIVVKRAVQAPPLGGLKPLRSLESKMLRFDHYG